MRLAGTEKGGFFPYPNNMAKATASWFIPPLPETRGGCLTHAKVRAKQARPEASHGLRDLFECVPNRPLPTHNHDDYLPTVH